MPARIRFPLAGPSPAHPYQHATGLRALVLKWIQAADPERSERLHEDGRPKPYSLSPLWNDEGILFFDLCLLTDELVDLVALGMARCGERVRLGPQSYCLGQPAVCECASYEALAGGETLSQFDFRLLSPTASHAPGPCRKSIVLPSPELYFGSWLYRWNLFSPRPLDEDVLRVVEEQVAVAGCGGSTQAVRLDRGRFFIGFQGVVRFNVLKVETVPAAHLAALSALARLAPYCGTGVDTMRGMGQTEFAAN